MCPVPFICVILRKTKRISEFCHRMALAMSFDALCLWDIHCRRCNFRFLSMLWRHQVLPSIERNRKFLSTKLYFFLVFLLPLRASKKARRCWSPIHFPIIDGSSLLSFWSFHYYFSLLLTRIFALIYRRASSIGVDSWKKRARDSFSRDVFLLLRHRRRRFERWTDDPKTVWKKSLRTRELLSHSCDQFEKEITTSCL